MAIGKIKVEGACEVALNDILCVCGSCGNHDKEKATIEFNFRDQKVYYACSQCRHMNEMEFGKQSMPALPRSRVI